MQNKLFPLVMQEMMYLSAAISSNILENKVGNVTCQGRKMAFFRFSVNLRGDVQGGGAYLEYVW